MLVYTLQTWGAGRSLNFVPNLLSLFVRTTQEVCCWLH
jgi:hypothetical protein